MPSRRPAPRSAARLTAHPVPRGDATQRLLDGSLRLHRLRDASEVPRMVIEIAVQATGARRVLLALESPAGGVRVAAAHLTRGERVEPLLQAITPWLDDARRTRAVTLRHGPEGAAATAQRSCLVAPLVADGELLGFLYADIEGRFGRLDDAGRDLLACLASQAAVAMANARRFAESHLAEESQVATADILRVISESPTDVQPVFDAICERAKVLCGAIISGVARFDGEWVHLVAYHGVSHEADEAMRSAFPMRPSGASVSARAIRDRAPAQVHDVSQDPGYGPKAAAARAGYRSNLSVPMMKDGQVVGAITVCRAEAGPFPDRQVRLLQTFADQAVIAIQNVRLFNETKEALEQQTATAEVLRIISLSPDDTQPVFEAIVQAGVRLFGNAAVAVSQPVDGVVHLRAIAEGDAQLADQWRRRFPFPLTRDYMHGAALLDGRLIDVPDVMADDTPYAVGKRNFAPSGYRAMTVVPMMRDGVAIGAVSVIRTAVGRLPAKQIELLKTFADQAVIAIENVRLLNDTKEALERQTATAEILKVISSSPASVQPVFESIVGTSVSLIACDRAFLLRRDGDTFALVARANADGLVEDAAGANLPVDPAANFPSRVIVDGTMLHLPDWSAIDLPEHERRIYDSGGIGASLMLPLLRQQVCIGVLALARARPGAFSDKEIALAESFRDQAVIAIENARLFNETKEALEQQKASAEILSVISSSVADTQPVFEKILQSCQHLFGGDELDVLLVDEQGMLRIAAYIGEAHDTVAATFPAPVERTPAGRAIRERRVMHWPDLLNGDDVPGVLRKMAKLVGYRSMVFAPMLWEGRGIGAIGVARSTGPFKAKELAMLQTFADQAVIAIQNARLFRETNEALERQIATADILKVVSSSPTEVQPVFDAIARSAVRLCDAVYSAAMQVVDGHLHLVAHDNWSPQGMALAHQLFPMRLDADHLTAIAVRENRVIHLDRVQDDPAVPASSRELAVISGYQALLIVPMVRDGRALGAIVVARKSRFTTDQISLLQTFAEQAVIAVMNVGLFNETRNALHEVEERTAELSESLQYQTAISEVLRVISESPTDVAPVFEVIMDCGMRLFQSRNMAIFRCDGRQIDLVAKRNWTIEAIERAATVYPLPIDDHSLAGRVILARRTVAVDDTQDEQNYALASLSRAGGWRRMIGAPMLKDGKPVGTIHVAWPEPGKTPQRQLDLLKTFADQAVIAIENVRLLNETKEALEHQTATSEVLQVISRSTFDLEPVFRTLVESAVRLCSAQTGMIFREDGGLMYLAASNGASDAFVEYVKSHPIAPGREAATGRAALEARTIHILDIENDSEYRYGGHALERYRTIVAVPLMRDGKPVGVLTLWRHHVEAFTPRQIALVETFADQAVIAIENVRLFNETKEALQQQTATAEVLRVISGSVTDTQPVFDAIVRSCRHLFAGKAVALVMPRGEMLESVAYASDNPDDHADSVLKPWPLDRGSGAGTCILESRLVVVADTAEAAKQFSRMPQLAIALGYRSCLFVPLLREGRAVGCLTILRATAGAFDKQEVALAQTFADQAVIAIENARLFNETQEALERQTATAEVLQAISNSVADTAPVFERILDSCLKLFGAGQRAIFVAGDDGLLHTMAVAGDQLRAATMAPRPLDDTVTARAIRERRVVHFPDTGAITDAPGAVRELTERIGAYSTLFAPMLWEGRGIGSIMLIRQPVRAFEPDEIALLQTFADQAVIAIQNARLFNETQEALERQTATAEVLQVISGSVADAKPVFEKIMDSCKRLIPCDGGAVLVVDDQQQVEVCAVHGDSDGTFTRGYPRPIARTVLGLAFESRRPLYYPEARTAEGMPELARRFARKAGYDSLLVAPMIWEGRRIGSISIARQAAFAFSEKEIDLLQTFADQARDRDPERAAVQRDAGGARRRRGRQRSQERLPGHHEPRDPHADECGDRHERAAARHAADRRAARLRRHHPRQRRRAADHHQRHPRLLQDRGRAHGHRGASVRPARVRRVGARPDRPRAAEKHLDLAYLFEGDVPAAIDGDVTRLRQVLLNLLANAVKFTEPARWC